MKRTRVVWLLVGVIMAVLLIVSQALAVETQASKPELGDGITVQVTANGEKIGSFKEITGLESETEVIEYADGQDAITHKRPGRTKYANITLRRELDPANKGVSTWYKSVVNGKTERKSGSIIYLDREGKEVARYNFFEAWPCRSVVTMEGGHIIEEIEFVVEKVERA